MKIISVNVGKHCFCFMFYGTKSCTLCLRKPENLLKACRTFLSQIEMCFPVKDILKPYLFFLTVFLPLYRKHSFFGKAFFISFLSFWTLYHLKPMDFLLHKPCNLSTGFQFLNIYSLIPQYSQVQVSSRRNSSVPIGLPSR